jgi:lysosomal alpha-mannosidase
MTFEPWQENSFLIRFEHILENDEDPELSNSVSFNLTQVFPGDFMFAEVTLAGNQWIGDMNRLHFKQDGTNLPEEDALTSKGQKYLENLEITIHAMEMRTFIMSPPNENNHGVKKQSICKFLLVVMLFVIMGQKIN